MFKVYFPIGFEHIASLQGFDHMLFIMVLCAAYEGHRWRRVLLLLTGFTLGHSLTLALTAMHWIYTSPRIVELLIPCTILATSLTNVASTHTPSRARSFAMAAVFGLGHGCGFAGYFSILLGDEAAITGPLLAFNLGLESGQLCIAAGFYALWYGINRIQPVAPRNWTLFVSGAGAGLAIKLILEQIPTWFSGT